MLYLMISQKSTLRTYEIVKIQKKIQYHLKKAPQWKPTFVNNFRKPFDWFQKNLNFVTTEHHEYTLHQKIMSTLFGMSSKSKGGHIWKRISSIASDLYQNGQN